MTERLIPSQKRHDRMVERIADGLRREGFPQVRAAGVGGFEPPDAIDGFVPDVAAAQRHHYIYEVETEETLELEETLRQWRAFAHHARYNDTRFVIVVPAGSGVRAEAIKNYHHFRAEVREVDFDR
ncbi:MAG TPA: hypothetical protein VKA55_08630 [Gammaproteobacteria bacterium]|nr:hypothetical protein [Gammaproteobacteria bacterium]